MPSEVLCNQLTLMSQALQQAARIVTSKEIHSEQQVLAKKTCTDYQNHQRGDHRQVLLRKQMIEARKEFIENTQKAKVYNSASFKKKGNSDVSQNSEGQWIKEILISC